MPTTLRLKGPVRVSHSTVGKLWTIYKSLRQEQVRPDAGLVEQAYERRLWSGSRIPDYGIPADVP